MASITSEKITLGTSSDPVRLGFLELITPSAFGDDPNATKKFQGSAILDPSNAKHMEQAKFLQDQAADILRRGSVSKEELLSVCFGKDKKNRAGKVYEGFEGKIFVTATQDEENRHNILIGNRQGQEVMPTEKGAPYSGAYGIMKVTLWLQNNKWGKRINANLLVVQMIKDGPAFGAQRLNADEEFERLPVENGGSNSFIGDGQQANGGGVKESSSGWL